jgi:protein-disulfide isomerase
MKSKTIAIAVAVVLIGAGAAAYLGLGGNDATPEATATATTAATSGATPGTTTAATAATTTAAGGDATGAAVTTTAQTTTAQAATAPAGQPALRPEDRMLGDPNAPVTIIEYASMTCPHCAKFHQESMPKLKSEFIDKGLVRYVFRPFPLDRVALRASLMAECAPGDGYFEVLNTLFAKQQEWSKADNPLDALREIGKEAGIEESKIDGCMLDKAATDRIAVSYKEANEVHGVTSTPSFLINGEKHAGALPFDDMQSDGQTVEGLSTIVRRLLPQ